MIVAYYKYDLLLSTVSALVSKQKLATIGVWYNALCSEHKSGLDR